MDFVLWLAIIVIALIIILWFFPVALWFQALLSGVRVSLIQLVLMRWRGVNPRTIVYALITGTKAGLSLKANELEAHYLAKGNVSKVVMALISANKANIALDFNNSYAGNPVHKFYRDTDNRKIGGVCGGIATYFDADATLIRVAALFLLLCCGVGFWFYILCCLVL